MPYKYHVNGQYSTVLRMFALRVVLLVLLVKDCMSLQCYECCGVEECTSGKSGNVSCPLLSNVKFGCGEISFKLLKESYKFKGCVPDIFKGPDCKKDLPRLERVDETMNKIFKDIGVRTYKKELIEVESCSVCFEDFCNSAGRFSASGVLTTVLLLVFSIGINSS